MRPKIIYTHERRAWPFIDLPNGESWDFSKEEEYKTAVLVMERKHFDLNVIRETTGTLNIISFSGAPPGCVMLRGWKMDELASGIVRIQVEFHRRRMPFYMRVLPH